MSTITLTPAELAKIVAGAVTEALAAAGKGRSTSADRMRRKRERDAVKSSAKDGGNVTVKASQSVTCDGSDVTKRHKASQNQALPSPPPSLPPGPPNPPAPTPVLMREARACEEGLFGQDQPDSEPAPKPRQPPHKRISWNPDAGWTGILPEDREAWAEAFPACDITRQLSAIDLWLRSNPAKRKQNHFRFVTNWLSRQQEKGGDARSAPAAPKPRPAPPGDPCPVNVRVLTLDDLEALNNQSRPAHANR